MADSASEFSVNLVASDRPVYSGRARYAVIPDPFGAMAFLPGHEPILCTLQKGVVRIDNPDGQRLRFAIDRGFASFDSDKLTIAVGHAKQQANKATVPASPSTQKPANAQAAGSDASTGSSASSAAKPASASPAADPSTH